MYSTHLLTCGCTNITRTPLSDTVSVQEHLDTAHCVSGSPYGILRQPVQTCTHTRTRSRYLHVLEHVVTSSDSKCGCRDIDKFTRTQPESGYTGRENDQPCWFLVIVNKESTSLYNSWQTLRFLAFKSSATRNPKLRVS